MEKEEILKKNYTAFEAEHAKQEAIGFAEWAIKNYQPNFAILGQGVSNWTYKGLRAGEEFFTTDQLYTIYKNKDK